MNLFFTLMGDFGSMRIMIGNDTSSAASSGFDAGPGRSHGHQVGLAATNPIAHHFAAPLFHAGVAYVCMAKSHDHSRGPEPDKHHWVYLMVEGKLSVTLGSRRKHILEPGMICAVPEGVVWGRQVVTESARWIMFSLRCLPQWEPLRSHGAQARAYEFADSMKALVGQLLQFYQLGTVADKRAALGVSKAIIPLLEEEAGQRDPHPSQHADKLQKLFAQIRENPSGDWQLAAMTRETGLPVRSLTRHCQRVYGTSPLELVHRQRLVIACELLAAGTAPDAAGELVGYTDRASFSNMFYRHMGMRPSEYVKRTAQE